MWQKDASAIRVAHTTIGFLARVEGWGTMRESPLLQEFAWECLEGNARPLVVDLSVCGYLDSTFLGCLVGLHQHFGRDRPPRFVVAAGAEQRQRLLAPLQLHRVLNLIDEAPHCPGNWVTLCASDSRATDSRALERDPKRQGPHLLECHRRLAELGGANEVAFGPIVAQLADDLQKESGAEARPLVKSA